EDGIRDFHVTGVQTCALPIYAATAALELEKSHHQDVTNDGDGDVSGQIICTRLMQVQSTMEAAFVYFQILAIQASLTTAGTLARSEERRVGRESRTRWARRQ